MMDFFMPADRPAKRGKKREIYPEFIIRSPSKHLMIRGGDFYAVWCEDRGLWSTVEQDALDIIDQALDEYKKEHQDEWEEGCKVLHMWQASSGMADVWHKYCKQQMRDSFHQLDDKLIFANTKTTLKDYASKRLPYPLEKGDTSAWDQLVDVLYSPAERHKIEWAIGAIVSGDSVKIQKFLVLYGAAGTGKSTILNIIEQLFEGYTCVFDARALGSASNSFALEAFRSNPLVAIQHDGDLSKIEDNTRLNSLVSHEVMTVNEKFKATYATRFKSFLFMGTNKPVRITDAKSGLIRRLIDVSPTGEKIKYAEYKRLMQEISFELGAIAYKCLGVYKADPYYYDNYIPVSMLGASNDFYNFVMDSWPLFKKEDETTLKAAWAMYNVYCQEAKVAYPYSQRAFKEELKNYFRTYVDRETLPDGTRVRSLYRGFRWDKFEESQDDDPGNVAPQLVIKLVLKEQPSILDDILKDYPAQYANEDGKPRIKWANVHTTLKDLNTAKTHYVKVPRNLIVIDFDISDENGEKDFAKNLQEASKWPSTYAEVSKSGKAIHLHYFYTGDPEKLSMVYSDQIEVKVFKGDSSLRRKLTLCNDIPVAEISSGLPLKEEVKTVDVKQIRSEHKLRELIKRNLFKEIHPGTKPSIDFIFKILEDAYNSDSLSYDIHDMANAITAFAAGSTHQAEYCLKLVNKMHFKSKDLEASEAIDIALSNDSPIVFYDVEVFPNLFLVNWKLEGTDQPVNRMINPTPAQVESLLRYRLVGFNCRRYDNHILYARLMGYSNQQLFGLSQRIIDGAKRSDAFFAEAYNLSYTDIYDFASAANKKSLKKFEIELGIHHEELGIPWDKPVDEKLWAKVAEYCDNDVIATEAVFNYLSADWTARQILADIAGMSVNNTTNQLTARIIFDQVRKPQSEFNYRDLSQPVHELKQEVLAFLKDACPGMMAQRHGDEDSLLPYFPEYSYEKGVSTYQGEEVGEGGYVYAEPKMYGNVALLDIASMHPHSVIAECLFGPRFTRRFKEIVDGRVSIKHKAWDEVNDILDGKLGPYIKRVQSGEMKAKDLANALKTAINSVYGLTSAAFENAFRDPRNKDNIVAKRGALFMVNLKKEVQKRGYTVAHIKTDSIKIPDAGIDIIRFVQEYGQKYGYTFEHEATYDKMCLVNDAVYIAKYDTEERCIARYGYSPDENKEHGGQWTATGKQFQVPYVFKTLFSREKVVFEDLCETFSVTGSLYLDMNEDLPDVSRQEAMFSKKLKDLNMSFEDWQDLKAKESTGLSVNDERYLRDLECEIARGHAYEFVGRVGQFTPVVSGCGGGILLRESGGKYAAATGSKGYRWLESEMIKKLHLEDKVDMSYYIRLADEAAESIGQYIDFEWFRSEDHYDVPPEGDDHDRV